MLSKLMYGLNFLLQQNSGTGSNANIETGGADWAADIAKKIYVIVDSLLWPIFGIIAVLGIVYAIVLGVNYAKAETSDKKEEAKKRIINAVVGVVVMLALIVILKVFVGNISAVQRWVNNTSTNSNSSGS